MTFSFVQVIDILGTAAFAVSGASHAMQKKLDIFGVLVLGFVTAIGGGTLRDMMIGNTPVDWLKNEMTIAVIIGSTLITFFFEPFITKFSKTLFLFDSLGLALFTVVGIEKGLGVGLLPGVCIALGTITACFGGVIRDVLLNNVPVIFKKEIYASACIAGGIGYFVLHHVGVPTKLTQLSCFVIIVLIRVVAVRYQLSLPAFYIKKEKQ
jgi:uncharacterized membrane protein YeiH